MERRKTGKETLSPTTVRSPLSFEIEEGNNLTLSYLKLILSKLTSNYPPDTFSIYSPFSCQLRREALSDLRD